MLNIASRTMIIPADGNRATGELRMSQPWKIEFGIDPPLSVCHAAPLDGARNAILRPAAVEYRALTFFSIGIC